MEEQVGGLAGQLFRTFMQRGDDGFSGFFAHFLRNLGRALGEKRGDIA